MSGLSKPSDKDSLSRRKKKRYPWKMPVELHFGEDLIRLTHTRNLSEGGMFVAAKKDLPQQGDSVGFKIEIGGMTIEGKGQVRWSQKDDQSSSVPGMGIQFDGMDEQCKAFLLNLLENLEVDKVKE